MLFTGWLQCPWGAGLAASHVLPTPQRTIQPVEVPEHLLRKRRAWTDAGFGNRLQAAIHQLSIIALNIHEAFNLFLQLPAGLLMWILPFPLLAFVFAHTHSAFQIATETYISTQGAADAECAGLLRLLLLWRLEGTFLELPKSQRVSALTMWTRDFVGFREKVVA